MVTSELFRRLIVVILLGCALSAMLATSKMSAQPAVITGVWDTSWSPDGIYIASVVSLQEVREVQNVQIWSGSDGNPLRVLSGHTSFILGIDWHPNLHELATASADGTVRVWDVQTGQQRLLSATLPSTDEDYLVVAWSPDGRRLAAGTNRSVVHIIDVQNGERQILVGDDGDVTSLAWSPDGTYLASGGLDDEIVIRETERWEIVHELTYAQAELTGEIIWPSALFSVSTRGHVYQWDPLFLEPPLDLFASSAESTRKWQIVFNPLQEELVIGTNDVGLYIYSLGTQQMMGRVDVVGTITDFALSPFGGRIVYGSASERDAAGNTGGNIRSIAFVVPDPTLDRLNAIAELCVADAARPTLAAPLTRQTVVEATLPDFVAEVEALPADAIPPACRADLLAVAEAIIAQQ